MSNESTICAKHQIEQGNEQLCPICDPPILKAAYESIKPLLEVIYGTS